MGIKTLPDRILITDALGRTRFDTNEDFFHVTDRVNGQRAFPSRTVQSTYDDETRTLIANNTYTIGSVNSAARFIAGSVKLDYGSGAPDGLSENAWFAITGGADLVHVIDYIQDYKPSRAYGGQATMIATYRFSVSGGDVRLTERVQMSITESQPSAGSFSSYTIKGFTMAWRLRVGLFT